MHVYPISHQVFMVLNIMENTQKNMMVYSINPCMLLLIPITVIWFLPLWISFENHHGFSIETCMFIEFPIKFLWC